MQTSRYRCAMTDTMRGYSIGARESRYFDDSTNNKNTERGELELRIVVKSRPLDGERNFRTECNTECK